MLLEPQIARETDILQIAELVSRSLRTLLAPYYSRAQIEAAMGSVFGVDVQIIEDGTYYVVGDGERWVGCGGWSRRRSLFGGTRPGDPPEPELDPAREPARIRAFFVDPEYARRGIGRTLLRASERAIRQAGFGSIELVATLAGEPLYASAGYTVAERFEIPLRGSPGLPVVRMRKRCAGLDGDAGSGVAG